MRERIRDKERLEHMLNSVNVLLEYKDKYSYEIVGNVTPKILNLKS